MKLASAVTNSYQHHRFGFSLLESFACLLLKLILCIILVLNLRLTAFVCHSGGSGAAGWVQAGPHMRLTQRNNHANISELLDNLLRGYDNSVRPDFGGPPATVEVDIMVRSMGPISEVDMTYSMDCYFRQSWVDKRLAFGGAQDTLALSVSMLGRIWKPDTYFYNGKQSYLHTITTPNKFVRIYQNGRVLYSSRLTIKAGCPMNLEDFPMDIQRCPLKFGSFGYTTSDVVYRWNKERPAVAIAEDMKLSQFDLVDCPAGNTTDVIHNAPPPSSSSDRRSSSNSPSNRNIKSNQFTALSAAPNAKQRKQRRVEELQSGKSGDKASNGFQIETDSASEYSMLMVNFHLQRHMGNFLIQVYGPCCLLVVLSWVSFWLNREATADRVSLGITTVLTMTFLGLEARTDLPKVAYPTALDFFVFLSFAFIFATILQFAVVHYFTKYGSGECYFITEEADSDSESEAVAASGVGSELDASTDTKIYEVIPLSMCEISVPTGGSSKSGRNRREARKPRRRSSVSGHLFSCFGWQFFRRRLGKRADFDTCDEDDEAAHLRAGEDASCSRSPNRRRMSYYRREELEARRKGKRTPQYNSVSKIDRASRVVFPLLFLLINVFYWCAYLSRSSRILNNAPTTT